MNSGCVDIFNTNIFNIFKLTPQSKRILVGIKIFSKCKSRVTSIERYIQSNIILTCILSKLFRLCPTLNTSSFRKCPDDGDDDEVDNDDGGGDDDCDDNYNLDCDYVFEALFINHQLASFSC